MVYVSDVVALRNIEQRSVRTTLDVMMFAMDLILLLFMKTTVAMRGRRAKVLLYMKMRHV